MEGRRHTDLRCHSVREVFFRVFEQQFPEKKIGQQLHGIVRANTQFRRFRGDEGSRSPPSDCSSDSGLSAACWAA